MPYIQLQSSLSDGLSLYGEGSYNISVAIFGQDLNGKLRFNSVSVYDDYYELDYLNRPRYYETAAYMSGESYGQLSSGSNSGIILVRVLSATVVPAPSVKLVS